MEENVKKHMLELIPEKVRLLMERHEACAKEYDVFFETMQGVFAGNFEKDPEATLERFLRLSDEECAWEKGDFRTRDTLLDNFIGRELARELKRELDAMRDVEDSRARERLDALRKENEGLRKEREAVLEKLSRAQKNYDKLEGEVARLKKAGSKEDAELEKAVKESEEALRRTEQRLREGEEYGKKLEHYAKGLEKRLQECLKRREPLKIHRMARILELGEEVGGFVPYLASKRLNIKLHLVYQYLRELMEIGMVEKVSRGYYAVKEKPGEDPEGEIVRRLASRKGGEED